MNLNARPSFSAIPIQAVQAIHGRGTPESMPHRFNRWDREGFDDGWGSPDQTGAQEGEDQATTQAITPATEVTLETARSILSRNDSPDIPFELSINPYRGCEHGCVYCYARPTHSYLNLSPGLDFETKLFAKTNAAELLRRALARPGYVPKWINIGSATDAYQPIERKLRITRQVIEVLAECRHPFSIVTKSSGVERDLDLLAPLAIGSPVASVFVSVTTLDAGLSRILEPRAAAPHRRLRTIGALADAGVPVAVNVAPIIPFINEPEIEQVLEAAAEAGARSAHYTVIRLPWEVDPLFRQWLQRHFPDRAERVMHRIQDLHGGRDYRPEFRLRMKGAGLWAELIAQRVKKAAARFGMATHATPLDHSQFRPPTMQSMPEHGPAGRDQLALF